MQLELELRPITADAVLQLRRPGPVVVSVRTRQTIFNLHVYDYSKLVSAPTPSHGS